MKAEIIVAIDIADRAGQIWSARCGMVGKRVAAAAVFLAPALRSKPLK
jgi:hypothetical protein